MYTGILTPRASPRIDPRGCLLRSGQDLKSMWAAPGSPSLEIPHRHRNLQPTTNRCWMTRRMETVGYFHHVVRI